jgi:DNA mismatch repair ATPase MutL
VLELSMHILDIVENSVNAGATQVTVSIEENQELDRLNIKITDNGKGMDDAMVEKALDPFITTKEGKKVGLGLSMLSEAARKAGGEMTIDSQPGKRTSVRATFGLTHLDRQPLGDMTETMITLIIGNPNVEFRYSHKTDTSALNWSTARIREVFGDIFRSHPDVIDFIREELIFNDYPINE